MEKKLSRRLQLLLPLCITFFCGALLLLASIYPYEKIKTYLHIGFMDNNTVVPQKGGIAGLNIVETDIDTDYAGEVSEDGEIVYPEYGTQYAVLTSERIGLYVPVYWGGGADLLEQGACNTPSSQAAGGEGNTVISAHVNTFFHDLAELKKGDTVSIYTDYGRFTYTVTEQIEFLSTDKHYLKKTEENVLTLYTCEPNLLTESNKRVGVRCLLEEKAFYQKAAASGQEEGIQ
ncbi:MAG: class D sortase [Oscillospiraceae bacterium]|nr:class D sortase [Oscillospiraceae bacterium]